MHRHPPQTPQEMIDLNYTFYTLPDASNPTNPDPTIVEWTKNFKG